VAWRRTRFPPRECMGALSSGGGSDRCSCSVAPGRGLTSQEPPRRGARGTLSLISFSRSAVIAADSFVVGEIDRRHDGTTLWTLAMPKTAEPVVTDQSPRQAGSARAPLRPARPCHANVGDHGTVAGAAPG